MSREKLKKQLEKEKQYHQLAILEFTDFLKSEYDITDIPPPFYDVLGMVLSKFEKRLKGGVDER